MKRLIALFAALVVTVAGAQTVQTTPNLITSGTTHTWTGVQTGAIPSTYMPGGPTPKYDPATNTFQFSYGQATVAQTIAINNALQGSGVQINGYQYSYQLRNMNGDDRQGNVDTITINTSLKSSTGATLLSGTEVFNTKFDWTNVSGVRTASTPYALADVGTLNFSATSKDSGFWAGYFGPQVRNVDMRLNYTVDPCVTNPAYNPSCPNYNTVNASNNLVPNPTGYATGGSSIDQSYAINQALSLSGSNVMIHGFQWGYTANANGPYCAFWLIVCLDNRTPSVTTNVDITDNNNNSIYTVSRTYTNSYNTTNYQYLFPSSRNLLSLGRFNFTATTNDQAYVGDMWSKALYTPDPCTVNPLSSTSCPGYQQAYHDQQCTINPLYASDCPGYQQAYLTQQCSANALYSPSCPGYQQAYFTQQCSINPLYSVDCPGYATAYHDQQCSINTLYAGDCPGYQQAYHDQQCRLSPLYATDCTGYQQAYHDQQCTINPLYASDCPGYDVAYKTQQCTSNPLYATDCPGYDAAYKNQQCSLNPLYATDCAGYQQAYFNQQCQANGLYSMQCPNYSTAYATQQALKQNTSTVVSQSTTDTTTASTTTNTTIVLQPVQTPVQQATTAPSTTSPTSVTSVTSVVNPAPASAGPTSVTSTASSSSSSSTTSSSNAPASAPAPKQSREPNQKQAEAKAKAATEAVKNATKMEDQVAAQGAVLNSMAFVPGFGAYQNALVPDINQLRMARQYSKPPIDNNRTQRLLGGAQEKRWNDMVDSQYNYNKE